jgi:GPH family glycoside/pentoside/hexuronide:cation symporter
MKTETQKLKIGEKIGYSLGDAASNLYFQMYMVFITYYYTNVFGITARATAIMFLIGRIWDAFNDPIMGYLADRTKTRWGKFRPYLIWFAIPLGVLGVLTFTTPDLSKDILKLVYAYITYILMTMAYTAVNVPYSALMAVITPSPKERTVVSSYRFVAAFTMQFIVQWFFLKFVDVIGGEDKQLGWQWSMIILASFSIVLYMITFATTKERVQPIKKEKTPFLEDLKNLFTVNKPWVLIGIATVFQLIFIVVRTSNIMYYFQYFVQGHEMTLFGNNYSFSFNLLARTFMVTGTVMTITGAVLTMKFSNYFDKAKTYAGFLGLAGISAGLTYLLSPDNIVLIYVLNLIFSFSVGPVSVLQWAIYTDTDDYSEWKTGKRATGILMAASLFALKLGLAVGGALLAGLLAIVGFDADLPKQTDEAVNGIVLSMSILPAIFAIIGVVIMWFYPLTNKMMVKIEQELTARRKT